MAGITPSQSTYSEPVFDASGCLATPGFVDAHTHLFPPNDRAEEFVIRSVKSYLEIAKEGGGILSTVRSFRNATVEQIVEANRPLMEQFFAQGTTTVEVKSGYGLTTADEVKSLKAIQILQKEFSDKLTIVPTFMGAHAVPPEYKGRTDEYVDLVCNEMIPEVAKLKLATYCDVFCEEGYFNATQTTKILEAAKAHGMLTRLHADEFKDSKGAATAARMGSHSADHLMAVTDEGIAAMRDAGVIPIVLPGATVFLGKGHGYAPMRRILDAGGRLAMATDHNPGSSVHQSMAQMMQLCIANGGITLSEALMGATYNPALSLNLKDKVGSLQEGAQADIILWNFESASQIPYYGGESRHRIDTVFKHGKAFRNPLQNLSSLHSTSFHSLKPLRSNARQYSTTASRNQEIVLGTVRDVVSTMTHDVKLNASGQITECPTEPVKLDPSVPHAPKRLTRLNAEERELAITNALKYFSKDLHSKVKPICEYELDTYGHVYFYNLLPSKHIWAIPFEDIPAQSLEAKAMIHMILNNLNPDVAQFPQELITYGGNGAVFSNWAQFHITIRMLSKMKATQTLCMNSGHPAGLFPKFPEDQTPWAVISNGNMIPHYSTPEQLDRLYALGVSMYGQMTAGSWMYIGPQGIVHGTTLTVAQAVAMQSKSKSGGCKGKVFVTSGLGGMSGAQPKAATINGAVCLIAEVDESALRKRHEQGWLNEYYTDLNDVLSRAKEAQNNGESVSIGYLGNVVELWEKLAEIPKQDRCEVAIGSDQTSLHNPYNGGYYPVGLSFEQSNEMMTSKPEEFKKAVQASLHRHLAAINKLRQSDDLLFFDYGNAFLLECHRAGCQVDPEIPSYVECIMGPEFFDYGFGPYRWVCTSGDMDDLKATDAIAANVLQSQLDDPINSKVQPQLKANLDWIQAAMQNKLVVGSKARILYSDLEGRIECAVRMNDAVGKGVLKAPVVIGRDHHDVSGTDSPWRETANIKDGSNLTADMSIQNVIGDAMRGATWVSLHNGGGTGWGVASNGGFGLVLDGSARAERNCRNMIFFDVANGLTRRARAGNPNALHTIKKLADKYPDFEPFVPVI
eukprot:CAMPEP_0185026986 /NCGR_PEP_ID=MMETSP1103-20130426/11725_1 /TAXON_ID=36769 /ORGANISM="Paraphysomonas bandaiensis, Strain Caron Lab Isolate" /LENGTH=1078 /DNA_ID=CAMNT_0027560787 /DNA_START=248 /DNA_END=3484 /DNA_ORIENTATION=-